MYDQCMCSQLKYRKLTVTHKSKGSQSQDTFELETAQLLPHTQCQPSSPFLTAPAEGPTTVHQDTTVTGLLPSLTCVNDVVAQELSKSYWMLLLIPHTLVLSMTNDCVAEK